MVQVPDSLNEHELARTLKRIDGFVPLEKSEKAHLKRAKRHLLSRVYVSLSYFGIVAFIFLMTYLHTLLGISGDILYLAPRILAAIAYISVMMWLIATERITWKGWLIGLAGLFFFCFTIAYMFV